MLFLPDATDAQLFLSIIINFKLFWGTFGLLYIPTEVTKTQMKIQQYSLDKF